MSAGKDYLAFLIARRRSLPGVLGWLNHWNAYVNLMLTLGGIVLSVTWIVGVRTRGGG